MIPRPASLLESGAATAVRDFAFDLALVTLVDWALCLPVAALLRGWSGAAEDFPALLATALSLSGPSLVVGLAILAIRAAKPRRLSAALAGSLVAWALSAQAVLWLA